MPAGNADSNAPSWAEERDGGDPYMTQGDQSSWSESRQDQGLDDPHVTHDEGFSSSSTTTWDNEGEKTPELPPSTAFGGAQPPAEAQQTPKPRPIPLAACGFVAGFGAVKGGVFGGIFGAGYGLFQGYSQGLRSTALTTHGRRAAFSYGASLAGLLAVYNGTQCASMVLRGGKRDVLNSAAGGFAVGAVAAIGRGNRNPQAVVMQAVTGAVFVVAFEVFSNGF